MKLSKRTSIVTAIASGLLLAGAAVAPVASAAPTPPNCTFHAGKTTCIKTSQSSAIFIYSGAYRLLPPDTAIFDGITARQICGGSDFVNAVGEYPGDGLNVTTTTITTTVRHGLNGGVISRSSTSDAPTWTLIAGDGTPGWVCYIG